MPEFTTRWGAWYGDEDRRFVLPAGYSLEVCHTRGGAPLDAPAMTAALRTPIDSQPLSELARGRRDAVVAVEDITRPAPSVRSCPSCSGRYTTPACPVNEPASSSGAVLMPPWIGTHFSANWARKS